MISSYGLIVEKASNAQQKIVHQDFSEKLQEKRKFEPQDMHFSKKSHSLHYSNVQKSTDASENEYLYHFSDVLKQNWVLLHKTVPAVILNVQIETKSHNYKINTKLIKLIKN